VPVYMFLISDKLLRFETTARQRRPRSKIEAELLTFFDPIKFRRLVAEKHLSQFYKFTTRPTSNPLIYVWQGAAQPSGRIESRWQKIKDEGETEGRPPDYCWAP